MESLATGVGGLLGQRLDRGGVLPPARFESQVGAVRIALSADFDADTLRRVVAALEAR